jgi:sugar-specific transcriptional regulator TrmB
MARRPAPSTVGRAGVILTGVHEEIVRALRTSGMSQYEALIYLGLLRHGPQNGNEVSKTAKVPSSKVYAVLDKLADEGIVHVIRRDGTTRFAPVAPEELVERLRRRFNEPIDLLARALPEVAAPPAPNELLSIGSRHSAIENCRALIGRAEHEVLISVWSEDLAELLEPLTAAHERGVMVYGMVYAAGESVELPGSWLSHSYQDIVEARVHGRMLTMVVDRDEAVIAHLPTEGEAAGVRTRSPALSLITQEYLHHDRVLQAAQQKIGFAQWDRWWQADADLRSIILGETLSDTPG